MWEFSVGKQVGPIRYNVTKDELVELFGDNFYSFKRTPHDIETTLSYDEVGIQLAFNPAGKATEIFVFRPNLVTLDSVQLLGRDMQELTSELDKTKFVFEEDEAGIYCNHARLLIVDVDGFSDSIEIYIDGA